jgi:hypothetical protein
MVETIPQCAAAARGVGLTTPTAHWLRVGLVPPARHRTPWWPIAQARMVVMPGS